MNEEEKWSMSNRLESFPYFNQLRMINFDKYEKV